METVFCDLLSTHTHTDTPFDVLALAGVSGDMLFLVCDDIMCCPLVDATSSGLVVFDDAAP